jgi:hypothetical protein
MDLEKQQVSQEDCIDLIDAQAASEETKTITATPLEQIVKEPGY